MSAITALHVRSEKHSDGKSWKAACRLPSNVFLYSFSLFFFFYFENSDRWLRFRDRFYLQGKCQIVTRNFAAATGLPGGSPLSPPSGPSKSKAVLDERNINEGNPKTNWIDRVHVIRRGEDATRQLPSSFLKLVEHVRHISNSDFDIGDLPQNSIRLVYLLLFSGLDVWLR